MTNAQAARVAFLAAADAYKVAVEKVEAGVWHARAASPYSAEMHRLYKAQIVR
jgi:hypothetical protein